MTAGPGDHSLDIAVPAGGLRIGMDMVRVDDVQGTVDDFGGRFAERLFSAAERAHALSVPALTARRLAARFAAKEAAIKAFGLSHAGVSWRELEVVCDARGVGRLRLHGRAAALAGVREAALSLSQAGGYAVAVVVA
jgi:holo-[acyl-carrier protein] synthase